jgi:DNA topoisomerase-1
MKLVIVESPAKCSKIQGYLGTGYRVLATMGHIRALQESLDAIGLTNDFEPAYEYMKTKAKTMQQLKAAATDATTVYLASDDDREGEAIAFSVCKLLRLNPATTPRIVFHEITEQAIQAAVASPRTIDMNRVNAQQARSMLDMMIGFTISPLLWSHVARGLSAGRCQTPALRCVVERENAIRDFTVTGSWRIGGTWSTGTFQCKGTLDDEIEDEESAINYMELLQDPNTATVQSNTITKWSSSAPLPLITSTLQQQASALHSIPPKSAMQAAQRLYEGGHITYMRTDMAILSEEAKTSIRGYITETYGADYVKPAEAPVPVKPKSTRKAVGGAGAPTPPKAQEAHECIRPTDISVKPAELPGEWSHTEKRIYTLIWQRALQSQMASANGENCTVRYIADGAPDFPWTSRWKRTLFLGWQAVGAVADLDADAEADPDTNEESNADIQWRNAVTILTAGTKMNWSSITAEPHETKAQPRYTEATLVRELETYGIGRPSTFASLIATIQDKNYVEIANIPGKRVSVATYSMTPGQWPPATNTVQKTMGAERQKLVPTDLGRSALTFALHHFNDLFDYAFTGLMEQRLDKIAEGTEPWKQVLRDTWASYKDRYATLSATRGSTTSTAPTTSAKVRDLGENRKAVMSKKGPLLLCEPPTKDGVPTFYGWPEGLAFQDMTSELATAFIAQRQAYSAPIGEWRGQPIVKKSGKFGPYVKVGDLSVSVGADDTYEQICAKLDARAEGPATAKGPLKSFKEYEIHNGQYGPYIIKPALKKRKFVSVPKGITIDTLTDADVAALYKAGAEKAKKQWAKK